MGTVSKLLLLGASNTYGLVGGGEPGPDGKGRGRAFKDALREALEPLGWEVVARGISGAGGIDWPPSAPFLSSVSDWLIEDPVLFGEAGPDEYTRGILHPWRDYALANLPADVVILMVAVGDAIRGWPLSEGIPTDPAAYGNAMLQTCEALLANGAEKVILPVDTPIVCWDRLPNHPWTQRIIAYREQIDMIWTLGVPGLIDGPDLMTELTTTDTDPEGWQYFDGLSDLVHPNELGHQRIADLYLETMTNAGIIPPI